MADPRSCMLMILDGWGLAPPGEGNAIAAAATPVLDRLTREFPSTSLLCSGEAVGLPAGIMGNSEVGHLNLGAGRIVYQDLLRIDRAISDGSFFENPELLKAMTAARAEGPTLHLMGLVSDGGVHSQLSHLLALVDMARRVGVSRIRIHAILDGRDTPPRSGQGYIEKLVDHLGKVPEAEIASICGRFYAMDRDTRWERIERAYRLITAGEGALERDPVRAVGRAYERGETDEFVQPIVIVDAKGLPIGVLRDNDAVVFFNFRADRAREITSALTASAFPHFDRDLRPGLESFVSMTAYDDAFDLPVAFSPIHLEALLGGIVSGKGLRQLRIAETEKYAHVTYFFNGGDENPFPGEERCLIPSPREIETYDLKPEMSAPAVADALLSKIQTDPPDLVVVNFANMDMVGHTGNFKAAVSACQTVDACAGRVLDAWTGLGGVAIVTADHGNAEMMRQEDGSRHTAHTTNPVPFILVDPLRKSALLRTGGILADVAPTILELMGIEAPAEMTGRSLLK
ncbi:MAG: 2,3-bisphosphoglycerate-independent phosphoglycerate mutase [Desulfobacterales bacterium]